MMKLLVLLSIEKENIQSLFDIKVLQYISRMKKPEKEDMDFQKLRKLSFEVFFANYLYIMLKITIFKVPQ